MSSSCLSDDTLAEELIRVAVGVASQSEASAREAAARSLFDFLGCVIGADGERAEWAEEGAERLAVLAHFSDQDDLHLDSISHPGGVIWSAVTACAIETHSSWNAAVQAAITGYEVTVRLAETFGSEHRKRWHATSVAGTVGAAAASALLLRCSTAALRDAVGHASSIASGSAQAQVERTATRLVHRAHAARAGVLAARAAAAGVKGIRHGLDQQRGAFAEIGLEKFEGCLQRRQLTCLEETGFRLHAASGFAHAAIDAALRLGPLSPAAIEEVTVLVSPPAALSMASNRNPTTDEDAWWSIEHAVATCLVHGTSQPLAGGLTNDPNILRICRSTTVTSTDRGWEARVEVTTPKGRSRSTVETPFGHGNDRPTDAQLAAKFERLTGSDGLSVLNALLVGDANLHFTSFVEQALGRSVPACHRMRIMEPKPTFHARA